MSVVVLGLNHRTVPLRLLERVTVPGQELLKALHDVGSRSNVSEAVVLSTCNRTEVYVVAERFHGAYADLRDFFCDLGSLAPEDLHDHLYSQHDDDAVRHLFEVAAGLDSDVLGESEILGQVKGAWDSAREAGTARAALNLLFRHAVEVGKRARSETGIARSTASVSHAAVELATELLGGLIGRRVLVVGAGEMGEGMVVALASAGVAEVVVANRTVANGERLAARVGGRAVGIDRLAWELEHADLLLASTGAGSIVVEHDLVAAVMAGRPNRPLLVVDIGVPRDVDPSVATIPGVTVRDLDHLRDWVARGLAERRAEAEAVREIVAEEVDRFVELATARQVAPLVASLHDRAEQLRAAEVERFRSRLDGLSERERDAVEALTRGLVAKLLHEPSVRLKEQAGTPRGERNASALRDLFDLDS